MSATSTDLYLPARQTAAVRAEAVVERPFTVRDIGILPLLLALPFMYFPKVLEGDTQPWVAGAALIALLTFRTERFLLRYEFWMGLVCLICAGLYAARIDLAGVRGYGQPGYSDLLRAVYNLFAFLVLWVVCRRGGGRMFTWAIRGTIVVWLLVGLYQYVAIRLGLPIEFTGRFVAGRSGVPSLTSEPATYGSLSVVHMMFLLAEKDRRNVPYILGALLSVGLSGSLLAMLLLPFPLMKLRVGLRLAALAAVPTLLVLDYTLSISGITSRLSIFEYGLDPYRLLSDASLNLRFGHIYFTMVHHLIPSFFLVGPVQFMHDYNSFAMSSGLFIRTGNNFMLPAFGSMIYDYGAFGAALLAIFLNRASRYSAGRNAKIEKMLFLVACLFNPITLANVFLIMYAQKKT